MFSLQAQVCGTERFANVEVDGLGGITVQTSAGPVRASTTNEAIRVARDHIGEFLQRAQRGGMPWGLRVTVSDGTAAYGEWPLTGGGSNSPSFLNTPLVRIRNRWRDSGPLSALANAIEIIHEYVPRSRRVAA